MLENNFGVNAACAERIYAFIENARKGSICVNREHAGKNLVIHSPHKTLLLMRQNCLRANEKHA
jgi:hypothetical protein